MINVKVKTLDSQNHDFSVEEEITVKDFKEHIAEKVNIAADAQRLIYCGRVLNDEKPLKEYDVNGKCLHLVQRAPPSSSAPSTNTTESNFGSRFGTRSVMGDLPDFENLMMGSFSIPVAGPHTTTSLNPSSTLCGNRITVARHMLQCADNIAAYLENPENGLENQNMDLLAQQTMESTVLEVGISAVTDADLPQQDVQNIVQAFQGAVSAAFRQNGINNITVQQSDASSGIQMSGTIPSGPSSTSASSSITIEFPPNMAESSSESSTSSETSTANARPAQASAGAPMSRRQQTTSTQTLGEVVGQMQSVQRRLDPFIQQYYDIMQDDPTYPDDVARENAQRVFDRVSEALHYMSHAQHAISDLMLDLSLQTPRHLCCRPILVEQSAFVSSGISAPTAVGSINIGPIFSRLGASANNNNNNNPSTANNNTEQAQQNASNAANAENFTSSLLSAFGIATQAPPVTNNQSRNNTNTTTTNTTASAGSQSTNQEDHDDASDSSPPDDATGQATRERYRSFIQSLMNANQPNAEVHIINANISMPIPATGTQTNSPTTNTSENAESTQARVNSNTQPTTSTQTRSTSRPVLTSTTLPPTSIRNFRPIPANILSSFDRFLPCNSHHIRDNASNQQQQHQHTQTQIHVRPVQRRTVSLDRNSGRQNGATLLVPARAQAASTSALGRRIADGVNNITDEELNHRFSVFGIQLSLRDLDNLAPSFYNAQREELRSFLRLNFFSSDETSVETVSLAICRILRKLCKYLDRLLIFTHPDYDVRKSIENLIMKSLPFIIRLITDDNSSEFGVRIERQLITFCENVYMILVKCIGVRDTEKYLNEIANMVMTGRENAGELGRFPRYIIQTFLIERRSYDLSEIQEFLVVKRPSAPTPIVSRNEMSAMEVDEEPPTTSPMVVENVESAANIVQDGDLASDPLPQIDRAEPWHAQFSSNWLPIITRDIARQQRQTPQRPYSDAYISGMSSKRRKILQSKKPSANTSHLIADGVKEVVATVKKNPQSANSAPPVDQIAAAISSDPAVIAAFRDEMKASASQRINSDPDFDATKFPSSSKQFK